MLHQNVTNGFPTLEGLALAKVRERPRHPTKGFLARSSRIACNGECLPRPLGIIPDGWFVEGDYVHGEEHGEPALFTCIEIEDKQSQSFSGLGGLDRLAAVADPPPGNGPQVVFRPIVRHDAGKCAIIESTGISPYE